MNMSNYIKDNKVSVAIALGFIAVLVLVVIGFAVSNSQDNSPSVSTSTSSEGSNTPSESSNTPTPTTDSVDQQPSRSADNSETTVSTSNTPTNTPVNNAPVVNNEETSTSSPSVPTSSSSSEDTSSSSSNDNNQQNTQQDNHNQIIVDPNEQDRGSTAEEEVTCTPPKVLRNNQCQDPVAPRTSTLPRITSFKLSHEYPDNDTTITTVTPIFSPANFADNHFYTVDFAFLPSSQACSGRQADDGIFYNSWENGDNSWENGGSYFDKTGRPDGAYRHHYAVDFAPYGNHEYTTTFFEDYDLKEALWKPTDSGGWWSERTTGTVPSLDGVYLCWAFTIHEGDADTEVATRIFKAYKLEAKKFFPPKIKVERTEVTNDKSIHTLYDSKRRLYHDVQVGPYIESLPVDSELVIIRASHTGVRATTKTPISYPTHDGQTESIQPISYPYADGRELDDITKSLSAGCPKDYVGDIVSYEVVFLKSDLPTGSSCRITFTFEAEDFTEDYSEEGINYVTLAGIETVTFEYPTLRETITVRR